jgi:polyadenylate-binding protein
LLVLFKSNLTPSTSLIVMAEAPAPAAAAPAAPVTSKPTTGSLYVGNLDGSVTEADLFATFQPFGAVTSVRICRDVMTKQSLGYGYANFVDPLHGMMLRTRVLG